MSSLEIGLSAVNFCDTPWEPYAIYHPADMLLIDLLALDPYRLACLDNLGVL